MVLLNSNIYKQGNGQSITTMEGHAQLRVEYIRNADVVQPSFLTLKNHGSCAVELKEHQF